MHVPDPAVIHLTPTRVFGAALSASGMIADIAVGFAILHGGSPWLFLPHVATIGIWTEGRFLMDGRSIRGEAHAMRAAIRRRNPARAADPSPAPNQRGWNAQTLIMSLLALVLFPGFGPAGCTVAFALAALPFMVRRQRPAPVTDMGTVTASLVIERPANPLLDLAVQPLVDIVATSDVEQKRAAIRLLGQQFDREAVHLLRGLLTDLDPDVRSEASVTLFRFEDLATRAVTEATARVREESTAEHHAAQAAAYRRAVNLELLEGPSAQHYLSEACNAYQRAATLMPEQVEYWVALAGTHRDLGNSDSALLILEEAFKHDPSNLHANVLRMEIAFAERRWDLVAASSFPTPDDVSGASAISDLVRWWSGDASDGKSPALISINADHPGCVAGQPSPEWHRPRLPDVGGDG